ncbi:hypothetical protein MTsDn1_03300 [Alteromonas sp. MTD1]
MSRYVKSDVLDLAKRFRFYVALELLNIEKWCYQDALWHLRIL